MTKQRCGHLSLRTAPNSRITFRVSSPHGSVFLNYSRAGMNRRFATQTTPSTPKLNAAHSEGSGTADSSSCRPQLFTVPTSPLFPAGW